MKSYEVALFYNENMELLNTNNLHAVGMDIPSIPFSNTWSNGEDGNIPVHQGVSVEQRPITVRFYIDGVDLDDYSLLKSELYEVFSYGKPIYIVDKRQKGKRYKVVLDGTYLPERILPMFGKAEIPFITCELPFAESVGTTALIDKNGVSADDALWGYGMGLIADGESQQYTHTSSTFRIYNAGDVLVHPFQQDLKIEISGVIGKNFEMRNVATGDIFKITDDLKSSDVVTLDGPEIKINGLQALRKTNRRFISLAQGWNEIRLNRTAKTVFDFRFYYL